MSAEMGEHSEATGRFAATRATEAEIIRQLSGDDFLDASVIINSAITLNASPDEVWPWLLQIGRRDDGRAGWYFPRSVERLFPERSRALRAVDSSIEPWEEGFRFRDWLGKTAMIDVVELIPSSTIVLAGDRDWGKEGIRWNWTMALELHGKQATRLQSRTRIAGIRDSRFNHRLGKVTDWMVAAGLRAGLNERLAEGQA